MTNAIPLARPTLVDRVQPRTLATDIILVMGGTALVAALAQIAIPLWPVPVTGQTLAVLIVGASLGAARGAASLALYAIVGGLGLPVFSDAEAGWSIIAGPTGGYIIGFVLAAAIVGWAAERQWDRGWLKAAVTFIGGSLVVFAVGLPWLAMSLGQLGLANDLGTVLASGFVPFIIGGLIKAGIAASLMPALWRAAEARRADEA